jgi:hypothetical protein
VKVDGNRGAVVTGLGCAAEFLDRTEELVKEIQMIPSVGAKQFLYTLNAE